MPMLTHEEVLAVMDKWSDQHVDEFDRKLADYAVQGTYEYIHMRMALLPTIMEASDPGLMLGAVMAGFELGWEMAEAALKGKR